MLDNFKEGDIEYKVLQDLSKEGVLPDNGDIS